MSAFADSLSQELAKLQEKKLHRQLRLPHGLDLSSNDYLCLSQHPQVLQGLQEGIRLYGAGSGASRLIRGHRDVFAEVEACFAEWVGAETSLLLANGFAANLGLINAIANPKTTVYTDRLNHASILDGIRLSRAKRKYYNHLDMQQLQRLCEKDAHGTAKIIVSETTFSMDGDIPDLQELLHLKQKYNAVLILDEAHALGVLGEKGAGVCHLPEYVKQDLANIDFRVYTAGKSLGLEGAFVACSQQAKDYLTNKMRTFIYSTAPMPCIAHAMLTAIPLLQSMQAERESLLQNARFLVESLQAMGYDTLDTQSQIIPVLLPDEAGALRLSQYLQERGFDIRAIRPPTVPQSRLRISVNAGIQRQDLENLLAHMRSYQAKAE
ncbi:MAG: 8-amino-7-oxononanoate synthase [Spirochaetota bacterium]